MKKNYTSSNYITIENVYDALRIWEAAKVSLLKIENGVVQKEVSAFDSVITAPAFIYTSGAAEVSLDERHYYVERFGIFHGGKGTHITIRAAKEYLEYYVVLYEVSELSFFQKKQRKNNEMMKLFQYQYGFSPNDPIFIGGLLDKMKKAFDKSTPLEVFYEKVAFYQLVYEILKDLAKEKTQLFQPDIIALSKEYMKKHYTDNLSIQEIANIFGISVSYFRSCFKKREGIGPQEYFITIKINVSKNYLEKTDYTLKEIAAFLGFYDEYHFSSTFKKVTGLTPQKYKTIYKEKTSDSYIGNVTLFPYNEKSLVSLNELREGGETIMSFHVKNKAVVAAAISVMLILSACTTTNTNNIAGSDATKSSKVVEQVKDADQEKTTGEEMRTIKTDLGEVKIPVNPKRIVGIGCLPYLVALDANYIDMSDHSELTYFGENYKWEELMALEPDLIIAYNYEGAEEYLERCKQIAPTVTFSNVADPIDKHLFIAEASNTLEKAQEQVESYKKAIESSIQKLKDINAYGKSVSIVQYTANGDLYVYGDKLGRGGDMLYHILGFEAPDLVQQNIIDGEEFYFQISMETLPQYLNTDYIVVMQADGDMSGLYENGVWKNIEAVKASRFFEVKKDTYTKYFDSPSVVEMQKQAELFTENVVKITK